MTVLSASRHDVLGRQLEIAWGLLDYHLERLTTEALLWEPAALCWTMRRVGAGWVPDWQDTEPDPIPVPTIAWTTWHIGWWWSVALDHAAGREPRARTSVQWPGDRDAVVAWLRTLHDDWAVALERLTEADLDGAAPFPWAPDSGRTVADMAGWVNVELMKNAAELGQLRLLRTATSA